MDPLIILLRVVSSVYLFTCMVMFDNLY